MATVREREREREKFTFLNIQSPPTNARNNCFPFSRLCHPLSRGNGIFYVVTCSGAQIVPPFLVTPESVENKVQLKTFSLASEMQVRKRALERPHQ